MLEALSKRMRRKLLCSFGVWSTLNFHRILCIILILFRKLYGNDKALAFSRTTFTDATCSGCCGLCRPSLSDTPVLGSAGFWQLSLSSLLGCPQPQGHWVARGDAQLCRLTPRASLCSCPACSWGHFPVNLHGNLWDCFPGNQLEKWSHLIHFIWEGFCNVIMKQTENRDTVLSPTLQCWAWYWFGSMRCKKKHISYRAWKNGFKSL